MHAVVVKVKLPEGRSLEEGKKQLESDVLPRVKASEGFVSGYWLAPPQGNDGLSITIYDSKEHAQAAADAVRPPEGVELVSAEVREVAASA